MSQLPFPSKFPHFPPIFANPQPLSLPSLLLSARHPPFLPPNRPFFLHTEPLLHSALRLFLHLPGPLLRQLASLRPLLRGGRLLLYSRSDRAKPLRGLQSGRSRSDRVVFDSVYGVLRSTGGVRGGRGGGKEVAGMSALLAVLLGWVRNGGREG